MCKTPKKLFLTKKFARFCKKLPVFNIYIMKAKKRHIIIIYDLNNNLWIPYYKFYVRADLSAADGFTVYNTYTVPCFR